MPAAPTVRPMRPEDADAAQEVQWLAMSDLDRRRGRPVPERTPDRAARSAAHVRRVLESDPGGCWVADAGDGRIAGAAVALVRDGLWGLSGLAVRPGHQGAGVGRALLEAALRTSEGVAGAVIMSSDDERALRRYGRAGFALHPFLWARGIPRREGLPAAGGAVRPADDPELTAPIDQAIRGAARAADIAFLLERPGARLLTHPDRGYAVVEPGRLITLAARDEEAARALLATALADAVGDFEVGNMDARQQWAIEQALAAGLLPGVEGALCLRGATGPFAPYLGSGIYL